MSEITSSPAVNTAPSAPAPAHIQSARELFEKATHEISKVFVGQDELVLTSLVALFSGGHVLIEGVPGLGKTLFVRTLGRVLGCKFGRIQFTADLMPSDITGAPVLDLKTQDFRFRPGPVFTQFLLADEINRSPAKTHAALLEIMQEFRVTIDGVSHHVPRPFLVMATQNPIESDGTYSLPEAQLDRFFFKLEVGYSTREELSEILNRTTAGETPAIERVLDAAAILSHQKLVRHVKIAPHVQDYAVRLVLSTHPQGQFATPMTNRYLRFGASPRAAQTLALGAKVYALLAGRGHVNVEDIQKCALPGLRHRMLINFEGEAEGVNPDSIVKNAIETLTADARVPA